MSELFCIKRDDANVTEYVKSLRNDKETCDVTLVGKDGGLVLAHKNVITLNSEYLKEMLRRNYSQSPLIHIPEVNSEELSRILDFIYYGKVMLNVDDMEKFISQAKILKVKGMSNDTYTVDMQHKDVANYQPLENAEISLEENVNSIKKEPTLGEKYFDNVMFEDKYDYEIIDVKKESNNIQIHVDSHLGRGSFPKVQKLDANYSSYGKPPPIIYLQGKKISKDELELVLMTKASNLPHRKYKCKICDHVSKNGSHIREHIERHMTDLLYTCRLCSRKSKTSNAHRGHFNQGKCIKR